LIPWQTEHLITDTRPQVIYKGNPSRLTPATQSQALHTQSSSTSVPDWIHDLVQRTHGPPTTLESSYSMGTETTPSGDPTPAPADGSRSQPGLTATKRGIQDREAEDQTSCETKERKRRRLRQSYLGTPSPMAQAPRKCDVPEKKTPPHLARAEQLARESTTAAEINVSPLVNISISPKRSESVLSGSRAQSDSKIPRSTDTLGIINGTLHRIFRMNQIVGRPTSEASVMK